MISLSAHFSKNMKSICINVRKNNFCRNTESIKGAPNSGALTVFVALIRHLNKDYHEAVCKNKPMDYKLPKEIHELMYGPYNPQPKKVELEVMKIAQDSIVRTMNNIMNRVQDSKKGIMYPEQYFKELGTECYRLRHYFSQTDELKNKGYPCFKLAEDICNFVARSGIVPSTAIRSFIDGPIAADCASTVQAVYLNAVLDVLGEEKFDKLFEKRQSKLRIRRWGCADEQSSLFPLIEFLNPKYERINENHLSIGDYIIVPGVPFYSVKRPFGVMSSLHSLVMSHDIFNQPLIAGLELDRPASLRQVKQCLVDAYNEPISFMELEHFNQPRVINVLSEKIKKRVNPIKLDRESILKHYSVEEAEALGAFNIRSAWRLSTVVLAKLKEAPIEMDLNSVLHEGRALALARQFNPLYKKPPE